MSDTQRNGETGPKRIAVIMAHPDDAEFGCGGTVAKWAQEGHYIMYVLLTSGDKGSDDPTMTPDRLMTMREAEQRAACGVLGVKEVHFLRKLDATLAPDLDLRRDMTRVIRQLKPDVVVCQDPMQRYSGPEYINHQDHRAAGEAVLAAVYPSARDRLTFPELLAEGLEPHKAHEIYLMGAEHPDVWVDITDTMETKIAALRDHKSQVQGWDPAERMYEWASQTAEANPGHGKFIEGFKYFKID
jgi:LmbE family N-acetylglucosaminyl deacetylase